jgi:hypothetical protein
MIDAPQIQLVRHLKALKLPTFLREYDKVARLRAAEGVNHPRSAMQLYQDDRSRAMDGEAPDQGGAVPDWFEVNRIGHNYHTSL